MKLKILVTAIIIFGAIGTEKMAELILFPSTSMDIAVQQVEDAESGFHQVQAFEYFKSVFFIILWGISLLVIFLIWKETLIKNLKGLKNEKDFTNNSVD